jgi:hypothetical protein
MASSVPGIVERRAAGCRSPSKESTKPLIDLARNYFDTTTGKVVEKDVLRHWGSRRFDRESSAYAEEELPKDPEKMVKQLKKDHKDLVKFTEERWLAQLKQRAEENGMMLKVNSNVGVKANKDIKTAVEDLDYTPEHVEMVLMTFYSHLDIGWVNAMTDEWLLKMGYKLKDLPEGSGKEQKEANQRGGPGAVVRVKKKNMNTTYMNGLMKKKGWKVAITGKSPFCCTICTHWFSTCTFVWFTRTRDEYSYCTLLF